MDLSPHGTYTFWKRQWESQMLLHQMKERQNELYHTIACCLEIIPFVWFYQM